MSCPARNRPYPKEHLPLILNHHISPRPLDIFLCVISSFHPFFAHPSAPTRSRSSSKTSSYYSSGLLVLDGRTLVAPYISPFLQCRHQVNPVVCIHSILYSHKWV